MVNVNLDLHQEKPSQKVISYYLDRNNGDIFKP